MVAAADSVGSDGGVAGGSAMPSLSLRLLSASLTWPSDIGPKFGIPNRSASVLWTSWATVCTSSRVKAFVARFGNLRLDTGRADATCCLLLEFGVTLIAPQMTGRDAGYIIERSTRVFLKECGAPYHLGNIKIVVISSTNRAASSKFGDGSRKRLG